MVQIKGQRATSLTFSFLKLVTIESNFRDKDYSNTFILPNTKPNMFKYYGTNQGTTSDKSKLLISQTCKRRGHNLNFVQGPFHFTEFKTKYVQISGFASTDIEGQVQPSYLSN